MMDAKENEEVRRMIHVWAMQCMAELSDRLGEDRLPPALPALLNLLNLVDRPTGYRIAFAGRFGAGKTTLVNNVLGVRMLPEGMTETTAIPTCVRRGESERLLLRKSGSSWFEASEGERKEFLELRASRVSPLMRRYLEQQDEVIFEHPAMQAEVEIVDLPGVSSTVKSVERRALHALRSANGIVWVASAKDGGLTRTDLDYIERNVPQGTPILVVASHLDLMKPKEASAVLSSVWKASETLPAVVGVVGSTRGKSLCEHPESQPWWDRLVERARKTDLLKWLVEEVTSELEGHQEQALTEAMEQSHEFINAAGLSREDFERYLGKLFADYRSALGDMNSVVDSGKHGIAFHLDAGQLEEHAASRVQGIRGRAREEGDRAHAAAMKALDRGLTGSPAVFRTVVATWDCAAFAMANCVLAAMQTAATIGWRFETAEHAGDISRAFGAQCNWERFKKTICSPLIDAYDKVLESAVAASQERHKLCELFETGQALCSEVELSGKLLGPQTFRSDGGR